MPSYRARLSRDLLDWQERGIIDAGQRERIAALALAPPGLGRLQVVLALCIVLLLAPAVIAFVAANWQGLSPGGRMILLFLGNAAAVALAWAAARRQAREPSARHRGLADAAATLSLAFAAAALALVGQTFHVPPDLRAFAATVAVLGLATALVARSGGAALVAVAALAVAESGPLAWMDGAVRAGGATVWIVWFGLFAGSLSGWLPARTVTMLVLLGLLADRLGPAGPALIGPERLLAIGALAVAAGHRLSTATHPWAARLTEGGAALAQAGAGLCLLGILTVAALTLGLSGRPSAGTWLAAMAAFAAAGALLALPRRGGARPLPELVVLASAGLALLVFALAAWSGLRGGSAFWTVWGGIVPALGLVVAGHLDGRGALSGWALAAVAGLIVAMLAVSGGLLAFAMNLTISAGLLVLTLLICRRAERLAAARPA